MLHYFLVQDKKFLIIIIGKTFPTKNLDKIPTPEPGPEATGDFLLHLNQLKNELINLNLICMKIFGIKL